MSTIDIRNTAKEEITEIRFADDKGPCGVVQASTLEKTSSYEGLIISDAEYNEHAYDGKGFVVVSTQDDAENLIKALDEAITLGWFN